MSHFVTLVLVPPGANDVERAVEQLLAPFDEGLRMAPYKCYVEGKELERMQEQYKLRSRAELVPKLKEWFGHDGGVDTKGLYYLSTYNPQSEWDWWKIGGRWTGFLDGYDPETDPANIEVCPYCSGTGKRTDAVAEANPALKQKCNGCDGEGKRAKWPTEWKKHKGDICPVRSIPTDRDTAPFALVSPDGQWHQRAQMGWWACTTDEKPEEEWKTEVRQLFQQHADCLAVVVDCHI